MGEGKRPSYSCTQVQLHFLNLKMGQIVSSKTLVFNLNQTPGNYRKEDNFDTMNHGQSLKFIKGTT
jgi:hypothetical protein